MRGTAKEPSARSRFAMFTRLRMHFGMSAALLAVLALALPAFASADPLGSYTFFKSGLRAAPNITAGTAGSDGNVWFVDAKSFSGITAIVKITPAGTITEYEDGVNLKGLNAGSDLVAIATGPEGKLWLTDKGTTPAIAVVDPATCTSECEAKEFPIKEGEGGFAGAMPQDIVSGPGGNLWFTDAGTTPAIGKINPGTKAIEEFSIAGNGGNAGSRPQGIAAGSDGNLWFTDTAGAAKAIGRLNSSTHAVEEFATGENSLPGGNTDEKGPWGIVSGPDGNVWFTENGVETTKGRSAEGKAIGRITPSGTKEEIEKSLTYFSTGLLASSRPSAGLTAAPDGNLWFTDLSGVDEKQGLEINAAAELGGTYKLGFGGQETGWSGSGNISGFAGTGDVKRWPASGSATCTRKTSSTELTSCNNEPETKGAEVGMRISGTGIPAKTTITKISGTTITMSAASTSGGAGTATTNIIAGWVRNVTYASGKAEVGQQVAGTGLTTSEVVVVGELEGKGTIVPATVPTEVKTGVSLTGGLKEIKSVTTTTGTPSKGEEVSGAGIPAGATIEKCSPTNCVSPTSLTITKFFPTETATGVSLSANLPFNADAISIKEALRKLPAIGEVEGEPNVGTEGTGGTAPVKRQIKFELDLGSKNVEQLSCNGTGLTGTSPTCSVATTVSGVPTAIDSITTSGEIARYPNDELHWGLSDVTNGPGGNVWFGTGASFAQKLGKLGIEPPGFPLSVKKVGAGSGTVTSEPAGINCGSECEDNFTSVTLSATPESGSEFRKWGGVCEEYGASPTCEVTLTEAAEATAFFAHSKRALTVKQEGSGVGSISSKPKAVKCASTCTQAVASLYKGTTVVLTAKATSGSKLSSWSGCESETKSELEGTCTVSMSAAKEVKAVFGGTAKAILNPVVLSFAKATGTGKGTVKATGLTCEADCTSTEVKYTSGDGGKKLPAKVILKEAPAVGSSFTGWTGCESNPTPGECVVTTSAAKEVTAGFDALPTKTLTVAQEGSGVGSISSKPKGIKCASTCTSAVAELPEGTTVVLTAKATTGSKLSSWSGCESETKSELEGTCTVKMSAAKEVKAVFGGTAKAILNPVVLTLTKAGTGYGTVKATGLTCEVACTSTEVKYTSGDGGKKLPAKVILKATSQAGSDPVSWTGCESNPTPGECVVTTSAAKEVTATFEE